MSEYGNKAAQNYDKVLNPFLKKIRKAVVLKAKELNTDRIADFCCGTGNQLKHFMQAGYEDIVGVDLSENMIAQSKVGNYKPKCLLEDATNTTLPENYYDIAMVSLAMHEKSIEVAQGMIKEAKRVVKPGGNFLVVDYCFDKKSNFIGRFGASFIEKLVGGEHYENFKKYISMGGLNFLLKDYNFIEEKRFLFGAVTMRVYQL